MRSGLSDLRHAARSLARAPGFTLLAAGILAVGIGAAVFMFSIVHAVLLRSLPFDDPQRVVWMYNLRAERDRAPLSLPDVEDYRRDAASLADLAVFTNWTANLTGSGPAERLEGTRVSGNFFALLGLQPWLGRPLQGADEAGDAQVAVLTHGLWIRRFGGDRTIVGRGVMLNGKTYVVVGVLPPGFLFPFRDAELAVPLSLHSDPRRSDRGANFLRALARLAPGVSLDVAKADLDTIARRLQQQYPRENARKIGVSLYPLHAEIVRDYRTILWTLTGAVGVLLAVACGNLANLLLLRNARRHSEFALRLSLGASRGRVMRLLVFEAAVLSALGGSLGIAFAAAGLHAWRRWGSANLPWSSEIGLNPQVLIVAVIVTAATCAACGLVPAWLAARDVAGGLRASSRSTTNARATVRRTFVALQMSAAAVLLVAMGIATRGFARLEQVFPGFTPDHALSVQLSLPPALYANRDALIQFSDAVKARLTTLSGMQHAGMVSLLPLSGLLSTMDVAFPDRPAPPPDEVPQAHFRVVSPGYFAAAGVPVMQGRAFTELDRTDSQPVAMVSRTFAARHWQGESAVGKFVQLTQRGASMPREIVGVVADVKHFTLDAPPTADLYVPVHQMPPSQVPFLAARMFWVVRSRASGSQTASSVREAIRSIDSGIASSGERTLAEVVSTSLGSRRLNVRLLETFGQVATVLCALGVYAVVGFSARARRREFAIRTALGARRSDLTSLIVRSELWPIAGGVAAGVTMAFLVAPRVFESAFQIDPRDPSTYVVVAAGLLFVAAVASYGPVHRAGSVDPAEALKT